MKKKCGSCGKEIRKEEVLNNYRYWGSYCDGVLTLDVDPFAEEIHGDDTLYWDCAGNRYESAMDI